jgi:hypothetical protein
VKAKVFNKIFSARGKCDENFAVKYSTVEYWNMMSLQYTSLLFDVSLAAAG